MARRSSLYPFFTSLGLFSVECLIQTILLLAFLTTSLVQTYGQAADPSTGFGVFPYQTYLGESENINLGTGNVNIQIPLLKLPGRDGHNFELHLSYNSQIWYVHTFTPPQGQTINQYANFPGWNLSLPQLQYDQYVPLGSATTCTENYRVTMWDGRTIHFPYLFTSCYPSNGGGNEQTQYENFISSSDGCSADFAVLETSSSGPKLHLRNGETLWFGSNNYLWKDEDANGNVITFTQGTATTATDTVGRTITFTSSAITYSDSTGTPQTININWGSYNTNPNFPLSETGEQNQPITVYFVTSVVLPNGDTWQMNYDPDSTGHTYGELTKITYPTGGYTKYDYAFVGRASGDSSGANNLRQIVAKHVCKSYTGSCSTTDDTTITPTASSYIGGNSATTVIDPLGNKTTYTFTPVNPPFSETSRQIYSGTSTVLKTVATTPSCLGPTQETVTLNNDNLVSKKIMPQDNPPYTSYGYQTTTTATSNSVVTAQEYGYGIGAPGGLLRQKVTTLMAINPVNNQNYTTLAVHVLGRKLSEVVEDGTGNVVAQTQYEYDNYSTAAPHAAIQSSGAAQHDSTYSTTYTTRGNVTAVSKWLNTASTWLPTTNTYDDAGNVIGITDPNTNLTNFSYADNFTDGTNHNAVAYVTKTTHPATNNVSHVERKQYYFNSGLSAASCGQNFPAATACTNSATIPQPDYGNYTYDSLGRLLITNVGDGGQTSVCYSDDPGSGCNASQPQLSTTTSTLITSSNSKTNVSLLDGVGNVVRSELTSDVATDYVDTVYDGLGRKVSVSNPYRTASDLTYGVTAYQYEGLSRVSKMIPPDGTSVLNNVVTAYDIASGTTPPQNCNIVTDEAGKARESCSDALGRLVQVREDPNGLNYETDYAYDLLNNLTSVTQKGSNSANARARNFIYDSLSRLTSAQNPEYGTSTIYYTYDSDGNVLTKQAPLPNQQSPSSTITTYYTYDALNRLTGKTYKDGGSTPDPYTPPARYGYDGIALTGCTIVPPGDPDSYPVGRRTSMCDGSGGTSWKHDRMGRVLQADRTINAIRGRYETDAYNLDGSPSSVTTLGYGVSYVYNGAGRPISAISYNTSPATKFVTAAAYAPPGELTAMTMGVTSSFLGIVTNDAYNNRLQPILLSAGVAGQNPVFSECFDFHLGVAVTQPSPCSFSASTLGNNGNLYQIVNNRDSTHARDENFMYDSLNRIQQAYSTGPQWGETFGPVATSPGVPPSTPGIDAWGNLTNRSGVTGKTNLEPLNCPANTYNQLMTCSQSYDAAGNMTGYGAASYFYDGENRLIATGGYSYVYDGDGQRVEKCTEGLTPGTCASGATGSLYWRGLSSDPLSETDLSGTVQNNYVFFSGTRVARVDSSGLVHYYFSDQVGSHGLVVNQTGSVCEQDIDYYPYGGVESDYCPNVPQNYKFTGKERDSESGLDNFGKRYFGSSLGRSQTPDPLHIMKQKLIDPQQWNMYAYVRNNPLRFVDPTGAYLVDCAERNNQTDKKCEKAAKNFEKQRRKDLNSKDKKVRDAAAAWGDRGQDNHINVTFKPQAQVDADANTRPGYRTDAIVSASPGADHKGSIQAEFSESLGGSSLGQTISHEGSHIEDDFNFLKSYDSSTGKYNGNLNFTHFDTEFQAFEAGSGVKSYSEFQRGPKGYQQLEDYIYRAYPNANDLVFPPTEFPQ